MDYSPSSSSSSGVFGTEYDVFLSFRGEDTRKSFLGHLYKALQQKGIRTFLDNEELERGGEIPPSLIKAIRGSKISIIVFSKNYASSSWCLDELVEILQCQESLGQLVWPVFFDVDPSEVRNHRGHIEEALAQFEKSMDKKEKLPEWKVALKKASNLSGWHLENGDESQLIQKIVESALSKLNRKYLHVAKYPVGIEYHLQKLDPLIKVEKKHVQFVGVNGMGGIGKTTIAKAVFNNYADEFEGSSFLANVRETSKQHLGFVQLQETLLLDMLGDKNLKVGNIHRGINIIKERLCNKRVLLILDDVDELDQLETLAGGHEWFGLGSRIIITSRNKHLLTTHGANNIYEVQGMDHDRALKLFSWNAFKRENPPEDYLALSNRGVCYADGLPLALVLLGSFLCCRTEEEWQSAIHNLEKKPDEKLYEILKVSYDALQENEKSLFLDVACFFVGKNKDYVIQLLGSSSFCPIIGIRVLSDVSLINVEYDKLRMHHLIEELGKEIVYRESPEVGERSRLWSEDDVFRVFSENTVTNSIEGIMLKLPEKRTLHLSATSFKKMKRLRLLIFANVVLSTAIEYLSNELRLIDLPGYQFPTLPFNSGQKQLVILNIPHNHIHQLDKRFKNFERLKVLNLSHSKFLSKIPDLSTAPNLESLHVDHCPSLVKIHESVGFLTNLVTLDAQRCSNLRTVPRNLVSKYIRTLNFEGCRRLQLFPNIVEKIKFITRLNLSGTAIQELPSSIDNIVHLDNLCLSACKKLVHIPSSIYNLMFLDILDLQGCTNLSKFPTYNQETHGNFGLRILSLQHCNISEDDFLLTPFGFPLLQHLDLSGNKFVKLPSVQKLSKLSDLRLANCKWEIPKLPKCQINLQASRQRALVNNTWKTMINILSYDTGFLRYSDIDVTVPGSDIPDWFSRKSTTASITFDVPRNMSKKTVAVFICIVSRSRRKQIIELLFELLQESDSCVGSLRRHNIVIKPGNMWLVYLPASTLLSQCLPYTPSKDTKNSVLQKIENVKKIKVSFLGRRKRHNYFEEATEVVPIQCRFGIHVLWDQDEIMIDGKRIELPDSISNIIDRTFEDSANRLNQLRWSSQQKREHVSASTNMLEAEDLEGEEEVNNISEIMEIEEQEVAHISEPGSIQVEQEEQATYLKWRTWKKKSLQKIKKYIT